MNSLDADQVATHRRVHGRHHGCCVVRLLTVEAVRALPSDELAKLTLADTGIELMQRLLDASDRSGVPKR